MKPATEYRIISASNTGDLEHQINEALALGYELQGNLCHRATLNPETRKLESLFTQALIKHQAQQGDSA